MPQSRKSRTNRKSAARSTAKRVLKSGPQDSEDLRREIADILADPEAWLNTPNDQFGGRAPVELLGTKDEHFLREWVGAVKYGLMT